MTETSSAVAGEPPDRFTDGNQLAGGLRELFAVDMTVARGRCVHCGREGVVAEARVYDLPGLGVVARCPGCESVLLRLVRGRDRAWLDVRGVDYLEIPLAPLDPAAG